MPELLNRLENAGMGLAKKAKGAKRKMEKFSSERMVGVLKDWFPEKSSVNVIRTLREAEEL